VIQVSVEIGECVIYLKFAAIDNFICRKLHIAEATRRLYFAWKVDSLHRLHSLSLFPARCVVCWRTNWGKKSSGTSL